VLARWRREDGDVTVVGVLVMPLLALALGAVLHLGLYLLARQAAITAVQQGLTAATATDTSTAEGETIARRLIGDHSAAETLSVATTTSPGSVTMTATVRGPGLVPGLPRTITVSQTAVREEFLTAP
jgi:Flp pilus assembly protein TadG